MSPVAAGGVPDPGEEPPAPTDMVSFFDGDTLRVHTASLRTGKMVLHKAGLAATGYVIAKPGPDLWIVPSAYRNGTAQGHRDDIGLRYDIDLRGESAALQNVYILEGGPGWPKDIPRRTTLKGQGRDAAGNWLKY
jgi:hypothetical protein